MGYTTEFDGQFTVTPTLSLEHFNRLNDFWDERHEGKEFPGYYCQWIPNKTGTAIEWDENEKFYDYIEWIVYLIKNFLAPWGYKLNGTVLWSGESRGDTGVITITDNRVHVRDSKGRNEVVYGFTVEVQKELSAPRVFLLGPATETK
jgi:hypothetical protein